MPESVILAVDINQKNLTLLSDCLASEGYKVIGASSLDEFDKALEYVGQISLAVVDIAGFDRSIWDRCQRLRDSAVPFLVLSPKSSADIQQESATHGALAILVKPLAVREFLQIINSLIES